MTSEEKKQRQSQVVQLRERIEDKQLQHQKVAIEIQQLTKKLQKAEFQLHGEKS
jgi:flagellar biosynthesis chaperone FliJ